MGDSAPSSFGATVRSVALVASLVLPMLGPTIGAPWPLEAVLVDEDQGMFWGFGADVAIDGTTVVVGADDADVDGSDEQGAAYFYEKVGGVWSEVAMLVAPDGGPDDRFGKGVAISGDWAVIGAPEASPGGEQFAGAVYVVERRGPTWGEVLQLPLSGSDAQDRTGWSVDVRDEAMIVGAPSDEGGLELGASNSEGCQGSGSVYLLELADGGDWQEREKLFDPAGECSEGFGRAVVLKSDRLVVGAPNASVDGVPFRPGAVYVFEKVGGQWVPEAELSASVGETSQFGWSVAIEGERLLVGARSEIVDGILRHGAVYFFERIDGRWIERQRLLPSDGQEGLALRSKRRAARQSRGDRRAVRCLGRHRARGRLRVSLGKGSVGREGEVRGTRGQLVRRVREGDRVERREPGRRQ